MTLYKKYIDTDNKVRLLEWEGDDEYDDLHDPHSNLYGEENKHSFIKKNIEHEISKYNEYIRNGTIRLRHCRKCGIYFFIERQEIVMYKEEEEPLPVYCPLCRMNDLTCVTLPKGTKVVRDISY